MKNVPVIVLVGPTAVGKTDLSIHLSEEWNGEVISGDSMQIYKDLDVGTAKITQAEMKGITHHLIDIVSPEEAYSAARFQAETKRLIHIITDREKLPIIVGGTGLYIQSVFFDYDFGKVKRDSFYRAKLEQKSAAELHDQLKLLDHRSAENIHANNKQRVTRALEVIEQTGKPFSELQVHTGLSQEFTPCFIGLDLPRDVLYARINERVDIMFKQGIIEEAKMLFERDLMETQAAKAIGYKELFPYFKGDISLEEAKATIKQNSRRFAKRQLTWFRNRMNVHWIEAGSEATYAQANDAIRKFLAQT